MDQTRIPFLDSLLEEKSKQKLSFHMPGHKGTHSANSKLVELFGGDPHPGDLVELNYNIDYLHCPKGALIEAQALAAEAYGANRTFFLINGSTVGNIAAIMSVVAPGQKIIVSRASHKSVYTGLILSGAIPIYIEPKYHPDIDFPLAVGVDAIKRLCEQHPDAVAIHITSPNYYGVTSDVLHICEIAHSMNIPLIVDEAHGSHFRFHNDLPTSALAVGADIVIQSTHKTQTALTQSSMLHVNQSGLIDLNKIAEVLALLQSSSPSSMLLASLDAARSEMATHGHRLLDNAIRLSKEARYQIQNLDGLWCYGEDLIGVGDIASFDPTKLIIRVIDTGFTGFEAFKVLQESHSIDVEFADLRHLICSVTVADDLNTINKLLNGLKSLSTQRDASTNSKSYNIQRPLGLPKMMISPRDAFSTFSVDTVPIEKAVGRVLIDMIIPYPPGVPLLVPGEIIEDHHVSYIRQLLEAGSDFVGVRDSTLKTVRVML